MGNSNYTAHGNKIFFNSKYEEQESNGYVKKHKCLQWYSASSVMRIVGSQNFASAAELLATNLYYLWLFLLVDSVTITLAVMLLLSFVCPL